MEEREPLLTVAPGKKGVGKTYTTINTLINQYIQGNSANGVKPRKVIILDVNNEYVAYKKLALQDVKKWTYHPKIECRRVSVIKEDGEPMNTSETTEALSHILRNFRGGLLVIEDISKYTSTNIGLDLVGSLCAQRHVDCDVIIHFQSIGRAGTPSLLSNTNIIRLHKCTDTVSRHAKKFEERTEILKLAETLINNRFDKGEILKKKTKSQAMIDKIDNEHMRFFVYVNFDRSKIQGAFSKEEFMQAITDYIQENEKDTISKMLNKKDRTGKTIYNYEQALSATENKLFEEYYGNSK